MKFTRKPLSVEAVQWNAGGNHLGRLCKDHGEVRGTSYAEVAHLLGTSGCGRNPPHWGWDRLGAIDSPRGTHIVEPGDYIITNPDGTINVVNEATFLSEFSPA